jgi:hypothetical protein
MRETGRKALALAGVDALARQLDDVQDRKLKVLCCAVMCYIMM